MEENNKKTTFIVVRMTQQEKGYVEGMANQSHLNLADYVRTKLLDESNIKSQKSDANPPVDSKARFACDHDKELMRIAYSTYMFTRELLLIVHGGKVYQDVVEQAQLRLKEWGYEDE
jgi:hypothetical protein